MRSDRAGAPLEIVAVWTLVALQAIAIAVTYARIPADDLYNVSVSGVRGGLGRALVYLNYPAALLGVALAAFAGAQARSRVVPAVAAIAAIGCAAVFWPGVVSQDDLDAKRVNAIAAVGLALVLGLWTAVWRGGRVARSSLRRDDGLRLLLGIVAVGVGIPWIAADLGFSLDGVPLLGWVFQTAELRTQPGDPVAHPAVHLGFHHGGGGVLLVVCALLLSRLLPGVSRRGLRVVLGLYLAALLCYGIGNIANDAWLEQVVKRGWTDWEIPNVTEPQPSVAWAVIVAASLALWLGWFRRTPDAGVDGEIGRR